MNQHVLLVFHELNVKVFMSSLLVAMNQHLFLVFHELNVKVFMSMIVRTWSIIISQIQFGVLLLFWF